MATTKVALITASSAGLGAAIAKALIPTRKFPFSSINTPTP
jgi:NAD(P)-dependent dehydrogenase (short-subunit alcohol dehydrogenase family)